MSVLIPVRGRLYPVYLDTGEQNERKPFLVVSNNQRNANLGDCLAVRLTTTRKKPRTTRIPLGPADLPLRGFVLCDEIEGANSYSTWVYHSQHRDMEEHYGRDAGGA